MKVLRVLTRIFINPEELDSTIMFYENLFSACCEMRFQYPEVGLELAQVDPVLLIAGSEEARKPFQSTRCTFLVDALDDFKQHLLSHGAIVLEEPKAVPTGKNMRVRHPDRSIVEYVEHSQDLLR